MAQPIDGQLTSVSVAANHVVLGSNAGGLLWRRQGVAGAWVQVPAPAGVTRVAVADDGSLWCVTAQEQICRSVGGVWAQVPGQAKTVAVASTALVYVANAAGQLWKFDGMAGWANVPAPFVVTDVSVGTDGTLYAVDATDAIHRFEPAVGQWLTVPGQLVQIACHNAHTVVGVNRQGIAYQFNALTNAWTHLPQIAAAARVAASADGLYVVGVDQSVKHVPALSMPAMVGAAVVSGVTGMMGAMMGAFGAAPIVQQPIVQQQQQPVGVFQQGAPVGVFQQGAPVGVFQQGAPVGVFQQSGTCKKCQGQGGLGTFGPCAPGHMHFKVMCPVCQGSKVSALQFECGMCHGKGGIDTWGKPCEASPPHMHYKMACPACSGMGHCNRPLSKCHACDGQGGLDTWGKHCLRTSMHWKGACTACQGRAYI